MSRIFETLGWLLCEAAFRTGCRGPMALAYRAGCWCYDQAYARAGLGCIDENGDFQSREHPYGSERPPTHLMPLPDVPEKP